MVGGRMFKHEKMRNGDNMTCQFILESKVGLGPSLTAPQIKQSKHGFINKMSHKVAKNMTTKTLKYHNGKLKFKGDGTHL